VGRTPPSPIVVPERVLLLVAQRRGLPAAAPLLDHHLAARVSDLACGVGARRAAGAALRGAAARELRAGHELSPAVGIEAGLVAGLRAAAAPARPALACSARQLLRRCVICALLGRRRGVLLVPAEARVLPCRPIRRA